MRSTRAVGQRGEVGASADVEDVDERAVGIQLGIGGAVTDGERDGAFGGGWSERAAAIAQCELLFVLARLILDGSSLAMPSYFLVDSPSTSAAMGWRSLS